MPDPLFRRRIIPRWRLVTPLRFAVPLAIFAASMAAAPRAHAGEAAEGDIAAAESAFEQLSYEEAITHAESAIKTGSLSHVQLTRVFRVLALAQAGTDQPEKARDAFEHLLTYDPDYTLDSSSGPKIQQPFFEARGFWRGQSAKPGVEVIPVLHDRQSGSLRVTVHDPTHVAATVAIAYRWGATGNFQRTDAASSGEQVVAVPASPLGTTRLDYFVQAYDKNNNAIFELGNESVPKTAVIDVTRVAAPAGKGLVKEEGRGLFASPLFWIVTGVVVAGGATTAILIANGNKGGAREETLPPTRSNLGPILFCGTGRCQ